MKVLSFNLLADSFLAMESAISTIEKELPDIILFTTVTNTIILKLEKALRKNGFNYKVSNESRVIYELVASRQKIINYKFSKFSTTLTDRGVLWAEIEIQGSDKTMIIASVQLEHADVPFAKIFAEHRGFKGAGSPLFSKRLGQFDCVLKFIDSKKFECAIIGCNTETFEAPINDYSNWKDAWEFVNPDKETRVVNRPNRLYTKGVSVDTVKLIGTDQSMVCSPL